jgi:hypothetical protein
MALVPHPVMPRDFAFTAFAAATLAAIVAFVGVSRIRRADAVATAASPTA